MLSLYRGEIAWRSLWRSSRVTTGNRCSLGGQACLVRRAAGVVQAEQLPLRRAGGRQRGRQQVSRVVLGRAQQQPGRGVLAEHLASTTVRTDDDASGGVSRTPMRWHGR